jgi:hypothetical protein
MFCSGFYRFGGAPLKHMLKKKSDGYGSQNGRTYDRTKHSGGARIQEGVRSLGYADIFIETYKQVA